MNVILKAAVVAGGMLASIATAHAVPIEGNDVGDVASLSISGLFDFNEPDGTLRQNTTIDAGNFLAGGTQGYATVDSTDPASQISSFVLADFASLGIFLELAFDAFPGVGTDSDFDNVNQPGDFSFSVTSANLTSFDTSPTGLGTQTSFELIALGEVTPIFDAAPAEGFDTPAFFSLVMNGSSVDGSGEGSFSATITTPPAFNTVNVSEPGMFAMLAIGLVTMMGIRRRRHC